jgi:citrate synthase
VAALSTFYPESRNVSDPGCRRKQIIRLIGKMPTLAAYAYRHRLGLPYIAPDPDLSYTKNYMNMLWKRLEPKYVANPVLARALDVLFILHADHEQNCSTSAMRAVGSSNADPYSTAAAAIAALSGPLHGGANEEVLRMLDEIGTRDRIPVVIEQVKSGRRKLMGFGHRVYKNYDPRARIIKRVAEEVFEVTGRNPKIDVALELERIALSDEYFIKRKLYPNVDFYSGIIYQAMGFTPDQFTVLFGIPRTVGWLAQWQEMHQDPEKKIARPRQIYTGEPCRDFIPIELRGQRDLAA